MTDPVEANEMAGLEEDRGIPDEDRPQDVRSAEQAEQVPPEHVHGTSDESSNSLGEAARELKDKVTGNG